MPTSSALLPGLMMSTGRPSPGRADPSGNISIPWMRLPGAQPARRLSLSQTQSDWQLIENRAMLLRDERSCQAHCLDGRRSVSVVGGARGGNSDVAAADKRSAAKETNLQLHRTIDFCLPLSAW